MVREVITVNVGECGVRLGYNVWMQYCSEHNLNGKGIRNKPILERECLFLPFYEEINAEQFKARNLMVDLDANILDEVRNSKYRSIFDTQYLLNGKEDAGNNFARGHYTVGKEIIHRVNDALRKLVECCDDIQGFVINHSVGGGTGSGLTSLILERIRVDYRKKQKIGFEVYPFNNHHQSNCVVEPYNALLATHWLIDNIDISHVFDNKRLYDLCQNKLEIPVPTYHDLNSLITKLESSTTQFLRNKLEMKPYHDLNALQTHLVSFSRLHFLIPSISPLVNDEKTQKVVKLPKGNEYQLLVDGFIRRNWSYPEYHKNVNIELLQYDPPIYEDLLKLVYKSYTKKFEEYIS